MRQPAEKEGQEQTPQLLQRERLYFSPRYGSRLQEDAVPYSSHRRRTHTPPQHCPWEAMLIPHGKFLVLLCCPPGTVKPQNVIPSSFGASSLTVPSELSNGMSSNSPLRITADPATLL